MENKQKLVEAILDYQKEKNTLIKTTTGLTMIPDKYALRESDVITHLDTIIENFMPNSLPQGENCLHCNIYYNGLCGGCPYALDNNRCDYRDSLYSVASTKFEDATKEMRYTPSRKLEVLGMNLEVAISEYLLFLDKTRVKS